LDFWNCALYHHQLSGNTYQIQVTRTVSLSARVLLVPWWPLVGLVWNRILLFFFQDRSILRHINGKLSPRPTDVSKHWSITVKTKPRFGKCCTCFGCETKTGVVRILVIFQLCSAISFKRSRRELFIDVAERWSILKNYQNTTPF